MLFTIIKLFQFALEKIVQPPTFVMKTIYWLKYKNNLKKYRVTDRFRSQSFIVSNDHWIRIIVIIRFYQNLQGTISLIFIVDIFGCTYYYYYYHVLFKIPNPQKIYHGHHDVNNGSKIILSCIVNGMTWVETEAMQWIKNFEVWY